MRPPYIFILFMFFFVSASFALTNINTCTDLTIPGETYNLTANLNGNQSNGICLNIVADNIVLECNGFNLTGEDNGTGIFAENKTDILVKNCNIKNYFFNLFFSNVSNGYVQNISSSRAVVVGFMGDKLKNLTINQSYFYGNEKNVYLLSSNNSRLLNVTSGYSGFPFPIYPKYGISVESSNYTEIRDSFVYGSQSAGIYHLNGRYLNVHNSQLGDAGVGNSKNNVSIFLENSLNSSITANVFSFQENVPELYGILIRNSNSSTISSNLINNSIIGIEVFLYTYDYSIFNNTIYVHNDSSSSPFGFQVGIDASFRGKIENNTIQAFCSNPCTMNNTVGIIVDNFHNSSNPIIISNNHLSYLNFGILTRLFVGSANISIYSNNISKIIASSTYDGIALDLEYLNSSFISNNIINESIYGLYAEYAHNNTISGNNISYSSFGLYFKDSNFNNISYNYETNSTYGYVLNTADINILSGNTAFNNSKNGFYISGGGNTLENNTASFNREHGFAMIGSFDTNLTNNLAYRNSENNTDYAGFYIFLSIDINLVNNTAYSTGRGFWLADSFNTLLENNTAHSNTYGLYLENGNNTIAYNTHLYNDSQYDLYVKNDGMEDLYLSFTNLTIDNPFGNFKNYTSLHLDDIIMHGETYEISWTSNTQPLPLGRRPFANKFVNISALHGLVSLDTVSWFWSDEEVTNEGVSEDKLELWKYNESGWTRLNNSPNIVFNFMTLTNHNPASKYGILEEVNCPIISSSGTYSQKANIGGAPNPAGIISESYYACVIINASNVEYDCAGYNITDTPSGNLTIGILINSSATNVTIKNCNIISNYTSAAILVFNASNATIFNTTVVNNMNGIVFVSSNFSKVYNNTVVNNTNSNFYLSVISSYNNISNNLIAFSERGFLISNGSSNNVFEYNIIQNHTDGVDILWVDSFLKTQNNTFYSNVFYNNTQFAFMIFNSSFDHYISNSISGGDAGFVTAFVDSAIFDSNNVSNTTYGFFVYQSNKNNLTFNQINDSYLAFFLNESSSNLVSTNKMYNLTYGAYFVYAVDNTFSNNSIQNVSRDGVYLRLVSNNNYIYNNTIFNTGRYGIYVDSTHNNTIDSNLVYYNINNAIALGNAQNNTIANNTVHSGNVYGISLSNSWYNKVLNNTGYNYTNSSAGYVLYLTSTSHYNNISYNKLYNGRYAYVLVSSSSNNILSYNYAENMTIDGYAIGDSSSNNTLMFNNATKCSHYAFEFYENASNNTMINNTAYSNYVGVYIRTNATLTKLYNNTIHSNQFYSLWINNGSQTYVEGDHYYNNTNDIRVLNGTYSYNLSRVIIDNPNGNFENYTVLSLDDSVGAGEEYYINWSKNSTTLPSNRFSFASKFVDISILSGAPSIDSITWHWLDSELTGYNESKFELWKYNSSGWTRLNNTPDTTNNILSLTNMNPASDYGILQNNESECMVINESGVYILKNNITGAPYNIYLPDIAKELAVCIEINASDVEFDCQGYSIINNGTNAADGSAGILIDANRQNVTVKNCIVSNYSGGLVNYKAHSNFIYNNTAFNNSEYGMVLLYLSENNTVENNTAYDNTVGFFVYASNLNNFTNNSAYYNFDYGFLVYLGNGNRLTKNYGEANIISNFYVYSSIGTIITNNTGRTSNIGYLLYLNANNNYLYDNVAFLNNYGFYVYGSSENILENNTAYDNDYAGFMLNASANNNISNSIAYNTTNGSGFFLFESVGGVLRNISAFNNSNYGILLFDVNDTSLLYVNFSLNNWSGVYAQNSINLTLNNTITTLNNQSGLFIYSSENITLLNLASHVNKINGITLQSSENINITNAHLYNNSRDLYLGNGVAVPSRNVYLANITIDNPIGNLENYTVVDIVDSLETGTIYYINWSANPTGYPSSRISFNNKFIIIENLTSGVSIDSISWRWTDSELGVHDESLFELWKYNSSGWTMLNNTPDISNNVLSLTNMNPSSIYGILEVINCPLIDSPGTYIQGDNYRGAKNNAEPLIGFACVKITSSNVVYDCNGYNITDNGTTSFTNSYGILLNGSLKNVTLRNCNGVSNYSYGFYVYDSNDTIIFNSTSFNNVGPGFYIYGGFNNTLINNTAYNNSRGFEISMSLNVTLVSNEAFNNTDEGFNLISGTFFSILKDSIGAFNKRGFVLDFSYNATLINNTAYGNLEEGFYIYGGNNNTFENNTAYRNVQYGFVIYTSNNTFIRNLHLYNNSLDFGVIINTFIHGYLLNVSNLTIDNPHGNFENYTSVDIIDVLGDPLQSELYTINWSQNSTSLPNKRFSFAQKFINISSPLFANIDLISFRWLDSELGVHDESLFELWKYNASGWTMLNNTPDISNNVLSLTNMNPSSIYGILENNGSKCMLINESGKYNISNNIKGAPYTISLSDLGMEVAVCIEINASDVEFDCQGYSITNNGTNAADGSAGILIDANRQNVTVKNCVVSNYSHGIATYEASNNYIYNNTAYNNTDFGILLFYISNYNFVENNSLYYNGEGAGAYINSMNNNFTYNKVFNNSYYGIYIEGSDNNLILGNTLENHTLNNGKSIFVDESANTKIENNNFKTNYEHIRLEKSTYSVVSDNNLSSSSSHAISIRMSNYTNVSNSIISTAVNSVGILYEESSFGYAWNNTVNESGVGIVAYISANNNTFENNTVSNCAPGMYAAYAIFASHNNTFKNNIGYNNNNYGFLITDASTTNYLINNTLYNNAEDGFRINTDSHGNYLINNTAYNNSNEGFVFTESNNNFVYGNTAYNNSKDGFDLTNSSNNNFTYNTAYNNSQYGFALGASSNNHFENNIAYNNSIGGFQLYYHSIIQSPSNNNTFINNTAENNVNFGFFIYQSSNNTFSNNTARYNSNASLIILENSLNNTVENNEFYNSTFIVVINNSHYNNIANNLIYNSSQDCVALMYGSENNTLANNIIRDCGYHGVEVNYEAIRTTIFNNTIYDTTANGIDITKSRSNIISNNNITNSSVAISLDRVNNSRMDKNVIFNNRDAGFIVTFLSFYNIVSNNTIQNSSVGIFVDGYAFNNNLTNNTISESNVTAVALVDQNNTIIRNDHYHNNTLDLFVNNSLTYSTVFTLIDVKFDNPFGDSSLRNYSLISLSDALAENESYYINWSDKPTGTLPTDYTFFGKSIIIGNLSEVSINSITLKWDASEEGGYAPARFELWKNNGSEWVYKVPSQAVSPNARTITINNLNNFSAFSILQAPSPPPTPGGGGGGGCSRYVDIIYTTDCANDIITIKLVWKLTGEPLKNAAVELISREIGTVYLTTNASGEVSYKVPIALETMDYTIEFRETGSYCAATKEFQYNSCPIGCRDSSECADNEYCEKESGKQFGVCKPVKCDCGEVRDHECYNYDCCSDSQCAPNEYCDISSHICKEKPKCIGDDCCASDEFYNKNTGACEKIKKGRCGYIQDHKWYDYECCDDSDCKGDYQIVTKKEGFIGDMHKFIITGPYCEQHTCRIGPLANRNVSIEDPLGKKIVVETSATGDGQFLLENAGEYVINFITQQKIGANATVVSIKEEKPPTQPYIALLDEVKNCWWLLLLLLLVIVIGYIIYKRKVGEKYKFRR